MNKKCFTSILIGCLCIASLNSRAQLLETVMSININASSLPGALQQLQQHTGFLFAYEVSGLSNASFQKRSFRNEKLTHILQYLLKDTEYDFEEKHDVIMIGPMKKKVSETRHAFHGVVEDKQTGGRLEGVLVYDPGNLHSSTISGKEGLFSISTDSATIRLRFRYLGYKPMETTLQSGDSSYPRIRMDIDVKTLDTALFAGASDRMPAISLFKMSKTLEQFSFLPGFNGNLDLVTLTKFSPGVQEANDGLGSLVVRGGAPDQNLFLLDGAPVYGQTHLLGLASTVHAKAIKEVSIHKGTVSARYSGGTSSIWNIALKNGDAQHYHGSISLGTAASDFIFEGPIIKNKTSFSIAGRWGYPDYYLRVLGQRAIFQYSDLLVKLHHRFSNKDQVSLTAYLSADRVKFSKIYTIDTSTIQSYQSVGNYDETQMRGKSRIVVFNWRRYPSWKVVSDLTILYTSYYSDLYNLYDYSQYDSVASNPYPVRTVYTLKNGLYDLSAKWSVKYSLSKTHALFTGLYYTRHSFYPQLEDREWIVKGVRTSPNQPYVPYAVDDFGVFVEDAWEISPRLKVEPGLHFNQYIYHCGSYFSVQPRFRMSYQMGKYWGLSTSYIRMQQSLNRVDVEGTFIPVSNWTASDNYLKPQLSDQFSVGMTAKLFNSAIEIYAEAYFKTMRNVHDVVVVDTIPSIPATPEDPREVRNQGTLIGTGNAYGAEISVSKAKGDFRTWLTYALGWSNRRFADVNNGDPFPYRYSRRHSVNWINTYTLNRHWELSAIFSFLSKPPQPMFMVRTNVAATLPYFFKQDFEDRIKEVAYHRLDFGINYSMPHGEERRSTWNLSVLNVYNRQNPFYYEFDYVSPSQWKGKTLAPFTLLTSYTFNF